MRTHSASDTDREVEALLAARYRAMTPAERLDCVAGLNDSVREMALAGARQRHPAATEEHTHLRVLALQLGRDFMVRVYGWDPELHGW